MRAALVLVTVVACGGSEVAPAGTTAGGGHGGAASAGSSASVATGATGHGGATSAGSSASATTGQGGAGGACDPSTCPGEDGPCAWRACVDGACAMSFAAPGKTIDEQVDGDCHTATCDGSGGVVATYTPGDLEPDGNACTDDTCTMQGPMYVATAEGTACMQGGHMCDGKGACVAYVDVLCDVGGTVYSGCDGHDHGNQEIHTQGFVCDSIGDYGYCAPGEVCTVYVDGALVGSGVCL